MLLLRKQERTTSRGQGREKDRKQVAVTRKEKEQMLMAHREREKSMNLPEKDGWREQVSMVQGGAGASSSYP